jgi:hypothetical protein
MAGRVGRADGHVADDDFYARSAVERSYFPSPASRKTVKVRVPLERFCTRCSASPFPRPANTAVNRVSYEYACRHR